MSDSTSILDLITQSQASKEITANDLFNSASPAMLFARRASLSNGAGLNWFYYGGTLLVSGVPTAIPSNVSPLVLTANSTNYIEATASGVVSKNTTGFTVGSIPLYVAVCGPSSVTSYTDKRSSISLGGGSGSSTPTDWASARVYHVGQSAWMYATIQDAVTAINSASPAPSVNNRVVIMVWPGKYTTTASVTVPSYVGIVGVSRGMVQLQNNTTNMFICSGNNWFENFTVESGTLSTVYAFDGNDKSDLHFDNVGMSVLNGTPAQKFLLQSGATWTRLFLNLCEINYNASSGYAILLKNTAAASRSVYVDITHCYANNSGMSSGAGGSFQIQGCSEVRFMDCTIRGSGSIGISLEVGGVTGTPYCTVRNSYLTCWTPITNQASTQVVINNTQAFGCEINGLFTISNSIISWTANISVTGGTVYLKGEQESVNFWNIYGTLTSNCEIILNNTWQGSIFNNTTGAYTLTIKTTFGAGVVVGQGKKAFICGDGTDVFRITADL